MITILFFAQLREQSGLSSIEFDPSSMKAPTLRVLIDTLLENPEAMGFVEQTFDFLTPLSQHNLKQRKCHDDLVTSILVSCNHEIIKNPESFSSIMLDAGDEIAFFPPVTGG